MIGLRAPTLIVDRCSVVLRRLYFVMPYLIRRAARIPDPTFVARHSAMWVLCIVDCCG